MAHPDPCPDCGAPRRDDGVCPRCLIGLGLEAESRTATADPNGSAGVLETIGSTCGGVPRVLLRDTGPGEPPGPVVRPDRKEGADPSLRYRIDGEIARGGMGAVLKGRDPDLGRDVAIKVLREDFRDRPEMVRRFVEEAQIGGQLQHPGVVPVYELGAFADRRPFFSMKLVKGRTLAELLAERPGAGAACPRPRGHVRGGRGAYHGHEDMAMPPVPWVRPTTTSADLPRFLAIFL